LLLLLGLLVEQELFLGLDADPHVKSFGGNDLEHIKPCENRQWWSL
jgi:hypothetical protein